MFAQQLFNALSGNLAERVTVCRRWAPPLEILRIFPYVHLRKILIFWRNIFQHLLDKMSFSTRVLLTKEWEEEQQRVKAFKLRRGVQTSRGSSKQSPCSFALQGTIWCGSGFLDSSGSRWREGHSAKVPAAWRQSGCSNFGNSPLLIHHHHNYNVLNTFSR